VCVNIVEYVQEFQHHGELVEKYEIPYSHNENNQALAELAELLSKVNKIIVQDNKKIICKEYNAIFNKLTSEQLDEHLKTHTLLLVLRSIQSCSTSAFLSVPASSVNDMFDKKEHGRALRIFYSGLLLGFMIGS
ncbi:4955_t:CDS:2, partial [Dentiscutata heterogama]